MMNIDILKSEISDNYFYVVSDDAGRAMLIDPIDAEQAIAHVRERGLDVEIVLNTHFHPDHVGGNSAVLEAFPSAKLFAGRNDAAMIDAMMADQGARQVYRRLDDQDVVVCGALSGRVLDVPGHTAGHIALLIEDHLFSGDVIFVGGAGHCRFGGDPGILFETYRDVLRGLAGKVVFYPGHDYAVRNTEFVLSLLPEQEAARAVLEEAQEARRAGRIMLTDLGREGLYNPFMSYDDPRWSEALSGLHEEELEKQRALSDSEDEAVFRCLRELRNQW